MSFCISVVPANIDGPKELNATFEIPVNSSEVFDVVSVTKTFVPWTSSTSDPNSLNHLVQFNFKILERGPISFPWTKSFGNIRIAVSRIVCTLRGNGVV